MSKRIKHIEQLDSLRAIAALMIVFYHFLPDFGFPRFNFLASGVPIFFVISGYLITAILLKQRELDFTLWEKVKRFIIKRALRLFPIYYLVLIFFSSMSFYGLFVWEDGYSIYYYTYSTNILLFMEGWQSKFLNHLWTLAIEEQFYLFWPLIIFSFSYRQLKWVISLLIIFSLIFKSLEISNAMFLPFFHFDTLGGGALLAYILNTENKISSFIDDKINSTNSLITLLLLLSSYALFAKLNFSLGRIITLDFIAITLIIGCRCKYQGLFGMILNSKTMLYLGRISYGVYLYHKPIPLFLGLIFSKMGVTDLNKYLYLSIALVLTLIISHFSFVLIEKRFIKLKSKFDL